VDEGFDTLFVGEGSLRCGQHALDATGQDGTVGLESFTLKGDLVHDHALLEVDFVVGLEGSIVLESSHSFLGVSFGHGFLEEVGQAVGKVDETFKSISKT